MNFARRGRPRGWSGVIDPGFWKDRRVFITGHTGFKGAWLVLLLEHLGAKVTGYSLEPPTDPSLFELARVDQLCRSLYGDVRDDGRLAAALQTADPEVIFHLAAQSLVRRSVPRPGRNIFYERDGDSERAQRSP